MLPERRANSLGSTSSFDSLDDFLNDFEVIRYEPAGNPGQQQPAVGISSGLRGAGGRPPRPQLRLSSHPYLQARRAAQAEAAGAEGRGAQGYERLSLSAVPDAHDDAAVCSMQQAAVAMRDAAHTQRAALPAAPAPALRDYSAPPALAPQNRAEANSSAPLATSPVLHSTPSDSSTNSRSQHAALSGDSANTAMGYVPVGSAALSGVGSMPSEDIVDSPWPQARDSGLAVASMLPCLPVRPRTPPPPAAPGALPRPALKQVLQAGSVAQQAPPGPAPRPQPASAAPAVTHVPSEQLARSSAAIANPLVNPAPGARLPGAEQTAFAVRDNPLAVPRAAPAGLRKRDFESELLDRLLNTSGPAMKAQGQQAWVRGGTGGGASGPGVAGPRSLGLARLVLVAGLFALMGLALFVFMSGRIQARAALRPADLYAGMPGPAAAGAAAGLVAGSVAAASAGADTAPEEAREERHHGDHHREERVLPPHRASTANGSSGHHHGQAQGPRTEGRSHEPHARGEALPEEREHRHGSPGLRLLMAPDEPEEAEAGGPRGAVGVRAMMARFA